MTFSDDDLKWLKDMIGNPNHIQARKPTWIELKALLARLEAAELCTLGLAAWVEHEHGYWSSPKEVRRCTGVNSIDECDVTMALRKQFKVTIEVWRKAAGK